MNYDQLFQEGTAISSFIKNSNRIWEGVIVVRSDGTRVVLNEQTNTWRRLKDLEHVKLIETSDNHIDTADLMIKDYNGLVNTTVKDIDHEKLEKAGPSAIDTLNTNIQTLAKNNSEVKDQPHNDDEAKKILSDALKSQSAEQAAAESGGGDVAKAQAAIDEYKKDPIQETYAQLHPSLHPHLFEMSSVLYHHIRDTFDHDKKWMQDRKHAVAMLVKMGGLSKNAASKVVDQWEALGQVGGDIRAIKEDVDSNDLVDYMRDQMEGGKFDKKDMESIESYIEKDDEMDDDDVIDSDDTDDDSDDSFNYEDEDYLDIPSEVRTDVVSRVKDMLADDQADIEETIKSNFELSDDDAEEFIIQAMEEYIEETDVEPKDSIKNHDELDDEVEDDFEATIDEYDGPEDGLLDHLVDEYENEPGEAEKVYDEKKGNLTECVLAFADIVKKRLMRESMTNVTFELLSLLRPAKVMIGPQEIQDMVGTTHTVDQAEIVAAKLTDKAPELYDQVLDIVLEDSVRAEEKERRYQALV
jgi:hypothetical protein